MTQSQSNRCWKLGLVSSLAAIGGAITSTRDCALAQIKPDRTLEAESSVVNPNVNINGIPSTLIEDGAIRGANLFHSFEKFNVGEGRGVYFDNPVGIERILSRVTGNGISEILGTLGVLGNADLFLINPNGIIFGPNASLNISGSFVASTASSINFADGTQFSATALQTTPLLSISVPIGLQFGGTAGSILNQSRFPGLQVQSGQSLALVGGSVTLEGGSLSAPEGRIELGSVAETGQVSLKPTEKGWTLGYEDVQSFKDIQLSQGSVVTASGEGGGEIQVQGRRVMLTDGSRILAITQGGKSGGTLTVTASDSVELRTTSGLFSLTIAAGDAGDIEINTERLLIQGDGAAITTESSGVRRMGQFTPATGKGGDLTVIASKSVELRDRGLMLTETLGSGNAGDLRIETGQLIVRDGAEVSVSSTGEGAAGNLQVTARSIRLDNQGALTAETKAGEGNITLQAQDILLRRNSEITTDATEAASGGDITIDTDVLTVLENSAITANAVRGQGGNIQITTQGLFLSPDSKITASSEFGVDGVVEIIPPDVDPSQGLVELPEEPVNVARLIDQNLCSAGQGSEFTVAGRGGLPDSPNQALKPDAAWEDWRIEESGEQAVRTQQSVPVQTPASTPRQTRNDSGQEKIVEFQGWAINARGNVVLTAEANAVTPKGVLLPPPGCQHLTKN